MNPLFTPVRLGRIDLTNRLVMAPMTRSRADDAGVVSDLTATYYAQRAGAGMIVTEGVFPTADGKGYVRTPGVETDGQVAGWRRVADAVHDAGGRIVMQIMHTGRISHPDLQPAGALPVAPSAIRPNGKAWTGSGQKEYVTPRALRAAELPAIVDGYRRATARALEAGFDCVELHGATGYLPEQFLSSGSNQRTDDYGGSIENRVRFMLETLGAMIAEAGDGRVGLKLSPEANINDIRDDTSVETFTYLVDHLPAERMAYLAVTLFNFVPPSADYHALLRPRFAGSYVVGGGLTKERAIELVAAGTADAVAFGAYYLANPDLDERFRRGAPLNLPDRATFYAPGANGDADGYTDYPTLSGATA